MDGNKQNVLLLMGSILIVFIACMGTVSADDFGILSAGNTCGSIGQQVQFDIMQLVSGVPAPNPVNLSASHKAWVNVTVPRPGGSPPCPINADLYLITGQKPSLVQSPSFVWDDSAQTCTAAYELSFTPQGYWTGTYGITAQIHLDTSPRSSCLAISDTPLSVYYPVDVNFTPKGPVVWGQPNNGNIPITFETPKTTDAQHMLADECTWTIKNSAGAEIGKSNDKSCKFTFGFPNRDSAPYSVTLAATNTTVRDVPSTIARDIVIERKEVTFSSWEDPGNPLNRGFNGETKPPITSGHFNWDFGDGEDLRVFNNTGSNVVLSHSYAQPGLYTVKLTVDDGIHNKVSTSRDILVAWPFPEIKPTPPNCKTMPITYTFELTKPAGQFTKADECEWDFGGGDTEKTNCADATAPKRTYDAPGIYPVSVTMTNTTYKISDTDKIDFNPTDPQYDGGAIYADFIWYCHDDHNCSDPNVRTVTFENNSTNGVGYNYILDFGDGNVTNRLSLPPRGQLIGEHTYASAGPKDVILTIYPPDTRCTPAVNSQTIQIGGIVPQFEFQVLQDGLTVQFTDTSLGYPINSWNWNFGDGTTGTGKTPSHTYAQAGTYPVTLTLNGDNNLKATKSVILGSTQPTIITDGNVRDGTTPLYVTFHGISPSSPQIAALAQANGWKWEWTSNSEPISTKQNFEYVFTTQNKPTTYNIVLKTTSPEGAVAFSEPYQITVYPNVGLDIIEDPLISCPPSSAPFYPVTYKITATSDVSDATYKWDPLPGECKLDRTKPNDSITCIFENNTEKKFRVEVRDRNGEMKGVDTAYITPEGNTLDFKWDPEHPKVSSKTGRVEVTFTGESSAEKDINHQNWKWYVDGTPIDFGRTTKITFEEAKKYNIELEARNSCDTKRISHDITVEEKLEAQFDYNPKISSTFPLTVTFDGTISRGAPEAWRWVIDGRSAVGQTTTHTFDDEGTYDVKLTVFKGNEQDILQKKIILTKSEPTKLEPDFTPRPSSPNGPPPLDVTFTGTVKGGTPVSWKWYVDDELMNENEPNLSTFRYTFPTRGTYDVKLVVSNGVTDFPIEKSFVVTSGPTPGPELEPDFFADRTSILAGETVTFTDATKGGTPGSWRWFFSDGTGEHQRDIRWIEHTFKEPGRYTVSMAVHNGERWLPAATKRQYITVGAAPKASFTHTSTEGRTPLRVQFTDTSVGTGIDTWAWDFGNGKTSTLRNPFTIYDAPGEYQVTLTVYSEHGQDTTEPKWLTVREDIGPVKAAFRADPTVGQVPLWVQFTDTSTGNPEQWEWNFGDGKTSNIQNPLHLFEKAGTYRVTLTATKETQKEPTQFSEWIRVSQDGLPEVEFKAEEHVGPAPLVVCFTDETDPQFGATSWLWNFGDGSNSFEQRPCHTYRNPGLYTVTLEAKNEQGVGQKIRVVYVTVTEPNRNNNRPR